MDPTFFALAVLTFGLATGLALGWYMGSRPVAEWRVRYAAVEQDSKETEAKYLRAFADLEAAKERANRVDGLVDELNSIRGQRDLLSEDVAKRKADAANFADRERLVIEARELLLKEFKIAGSKVLDEAQKSFLATASERFDHAEKANKQAIATLLQPVGAKLQAYENSVREMEADRKKDYGGISNLMEQVRLGQEAVKFEAASIVSSLRSGPKTSGRWGEQQFENLLELAGLSKFTDYRSEVSVHTNDGLLRPDYVINLPGNRTLIVDIKCPLDAYLSANDEIDPQLRKKGFERYSSTVKGHAGALSRKGYWSQFAESPDFVILYVPGDNFLSAALEHDKKLWEDAARNRVIISGPATFFPLARTIAAMWDQEKLADKAQEVLELGRDLHENLAIMTSRIKRLGQDLDKSVRTYNEFIASVDGKVILTARKFEELNLTKSDKRIPDLEPVDEQTRPLMRLTHIEPKSDAVGAD